MRCAHVIPYMNLRAGGPVVVVDRLCRRMLRRGIEPVVLTTDVLSGEGGDVAASAAGVADAPSFGDYELRFFHALTRRFAYSPSLASALDEVVRTCDVVHIHTLWTHATWAAAAACRRHGVPYVLMPHGMLDPRSLARKWVRKVAYGRLFEFPRARAAAGLIYTTDEERRLAERSVRSLPRGHVVPLGTDQPPGPREELARRFLASRPHLVGRQLVTFLGRVHSKKGLDLLIPAFAKVASRVPAAHLLVIGPDDENTWPGLRREIESLGLQGHVTRIEMLLGGAKWAALAASRVFVLPSYQENFAIAVAEALRIGTPVVISDRVNICHEVEAAAAGRVVPCDVEAVAGAICETLDDTDAWQRRSAAAADLARRQFDWDRTAELTVQVYEHVLEDSRRRMPADPPVGCVVETG